MAYRLYDMHCHLDFMQDMHLVAREAAELGLALFATTVTPRGFMRASKMLCDEPNVVVGAGLHPWWVADGRANMDDIDRAVSLARHGRFIAEVGLDFSPAHADPSSYARQLAAFERLAHACADEACDEGTKVLSIHSVRSATAVLDVLERTDCILDCACIFHWFSGTGDELHRAVKAGCWFSVNEMMLKTRRGREYARQVPKSHLLLETDLPPGEDVPFAAAEIVASLTRAAEVIASTRGCTPEHIMTLTSANAEILLS